MAAAAEQLDIRVEFCAPCGHAYKSAWIAGELMELAPNDVRSVKLVPGGHGNNDVFFNGEKAIDDENASHLDADGDGPFIDTRLLVVLIKQWRAKVGRPVTKSIGDRVDVTDQELGLNYDDPQLRPKIQMRTPPAT